MRLLNPYQYALNNPGQYGDVTGLGPRVFDELWRWNPKDKRFGEISSNSLGGGGSVVLGNLTKWDGRKNVWFEETHGPVAQSTTY